MTQEEKDKLIQEIEEENKWLEGEDKWSILKKKQAENIARLAEEHPDDWLFSSEMKKPENQRVGFAPSNGICWRCGKNIAEGANGITPERLGDYIITGCPHCNCSFCD